MPRKPCEESKTKQKRGVIEENYKAWIQAQEYSSNRGTATTFHDWKTGREMHFLSIGEFTVYLIMRYRDDVEDIYERFPLDIKTTNKIAESLGYKPAGNGKKAMTTDLVVKLINGQYIAYSIKPSVESLDPVKHKRTVEKLYIEMLYWKSKGIPWHIKFSSKVNRKTAMNIKNCAEFWNIENVSTKEDLLRYLIIHKKVEADLENTIHFAEAAESIITDEIFSGFLKQKEAKK
jgi:hypothetical protein